MMVNDHSTVEFGRRGREVRASAARAAEAPKAGRGGGYIACLFGLTGLLLAVAGAIVWTLLDMANLNAESARAEHRVIEIVNQPITHLTRSSEAGVFSPGWFHPGAIKPDFNNVDIRATQEFPYDKYSYVTSDVTPSEMFVGNELEFNSMTKYFYAGRNLPKKRLSTAEMNEINGLYRVIGRVGQVVFSRTMAVAALAVAALCLGYTLFMLIRQRLRLTPG